MRVGAPPSSFPAEQVWIVVSVEDSGAGLTAGERGGPGGTVGFDKADDEEEEGAHEAPVTPKKLLKEATQPTPRFTRGRKREHSQGTLDEAFVKKRTKR